MKNHFRLIASILSIAVAAVIFFTPLPVLAQKGFGKPPVIAPSGASGLEDFVRLFETDQSGIGRFYDLPWSQARFDRE